MTDQILTLGNFRCFRKRQDARLAPITVLMGDNSSGKSSFLAAYRAAWHSQFGRLVHDFNEPPFSLGAYDQIAHFHGGIAGRAKSFFLGLKWNVSEQMAARLGYGDSNGSSLIEFVEHQAQPRVIRITISIGQFKADVRFQENWTKTSITLSDGSNTYTLSNEESAVWPSWASEFRDVRDLLFFFDRSIDKRLLKAGARPERAIVDAIRRALWIELDYARANPPKAFAPVRTHPRRTYDSVKEEEGPEGDHVPLVLANSYSQRDRGGWKSLKDALERFGQEAQLFKSVQVKRLGKKPSDPFQIKIAVDGPPANLIDVGYGVSQSLPLLVDVIRAPKGTPFLIQQPEVHLHPRAQAQLASHFVTMAAEESKRFIVETHSDYFLDRLRLEVRNGREITKNKVSILYFERKRGEVNIHEIKLDDAGNVVAAPKNYRKFFLDEEKRILG